MNFNDLLHRTNLNSIASYFIYGGEDFTLPSSKTYSERIAEAAENARRFFKERFPEINAMLFLALIDLRCYNT